LTLTVTTDWLADEGVVRVTVSGVP